MLWFEYDLSVPPHPRPAAARNSCNRSLTMCGSVRVLGLLGGGASRQAIHSWRLTLGRESCQSQGTTGAKGVRKRTDLAPEPLGHAVPLPPLTSSPFHLPCRVRTMGGGGGGGHTEAELRDDLGQPVSVTVSSITCLWKKRPVWGIVRATENGLIRGPIRRYRLKDG